jgi:uncharacterized protein YbaA (DUF1428 family)
MISDKSGGDPLRILCLHFPLRDGGIFYPPARSITTPLYGRTIMLYVDGFVVPVPRAKLDAYKEMSRTAGAIWRELGALEFRECISDDVKPGKLISFPQSVMLEDGEVVAFSWIVYPSRAKRDEVNDKVMKDPRMAEFMKPENMPFDGKRMIYGGFEMVVDV